MKKAFAPIALFFIATLLFGGFLLFKHYNSLQTANIQKDSEIKQLKEQVEILRQSERDIPKDFAKQQPFAAKVIKDSDLSGDKIYTLECSNNKESLAQKYQWFSELSNKFQNETIEEFCLNSKNNAALFSTSSENKLSSSPLQPTSYRFNFYKINLLAPTSAFQVFETSGNSLVYCSDIEAWTKSNEVLYRCSEGDGASVTTSTYIFKIYTGWY